MSDADSNRIQIFEYYQPIFALIIQDIGRSGYDFKRPHLKRETFWSIIPQGRYSSDRGRELINLYRESVEHEIANIISQNSIAYWLHLIRRVSPTPIFPDLMNTTTTYLVRSTLEAAVQKYGSFSLCERIGFSDVVDEKTILLGALMHSQYQNIRKALKAHHDLVLTNFGIVQFIEFYELEKLCFEIWRCGAVLRILGKGAGLSVTDDPIKFYDDRTDELDRVVRIYDARHSRISPTNSATGTVFEILDSDKQDDTFFILPSYNLEQVSCGEYFADKDMFFQYMFGRLVKFPDEFVTNFLWGQFNIVGFYRSHKPFGVAFEEQRGISLEVLIIFIRSLIFRKIVLWGTYGILAFLRDYQRAYEGPVSKSFLIEELSWFFNEFVGKIGHEHDCNVDVAEIIEHLALNSTKKDEIDILLRGPFSIFLPIDDDTYFIDSAWIHAILYHLFFGITLADQNFKGDALEELVHKGKSVLPTSQLRASTGRSKQIDAAFEVNDTLIIVECRVKSWSFGSERGDFEAVRARNEFINTCLDSIDDKARFLAENPVGTNYDISKYRRIVPIGVTPFVEFIPSLNRHYWLDDELPRIMTPDELIMFLDSERLTITPEDIYNIVNL